MHVCVCICMYMYACMHVYMCICMYVCLFACFFEGTHKCISYVRISFHTS